MNILFDIENSEFLVSCMQYLFVRTQKDRGTTLSEGCISFLTEHGFFAALGHNESSEGAPYMDSEIYAQHTEEEEPPQAGRILRSMPSGVYGVFYDDYVPPVYAKMKVSLLKNLKIGEAQLWMPIGAGNPRIYKGEIVALFSDKPHPILFKANDPTFPGAGFGSSGSIIVQDEKIAAVVAGADENPAELLYCTAAEQMAADLLKMIFEFAVNQQ